MTGVLTEASQWRLFVASGMATLAFAGSLVAMRWWPDGVAVLALAGLVGWLAAAWIVAFGARV